MSLARRPATKAGYDVSGFLNLYRRDSGIYWVRLYVPRHLQVAAGKREVHRSTGCRDQRLAKIVAAELVRHWHQSVSALKSMDLSKIQAGSLDLVGDGHLTIDEAATGFGTTALDLYQRFLSGGRYGVFVLAKAWDGWLVRDAASLSYERHDVTGEITSVDLDESALGSLERFSGELSIRFIQDLRPLLDGTVSTLDVNHFWCGGTRGRSVFLMEGHGQALTRAALLLRRRDVGAIREQLKQELSSAGAVPPAPASPPSLVELGEAPALLREERLFSDLCKEYFEATKHESKADHLRRKKDSAQMFIELAADPDISVVRRAEVREFAKVIAELPAHRDKRMREEGLKEANYLQLVSLKRKYSWEALSVREQGKILDHVRKIFDWAVAEEYIEKNPFKDVRAVAASSRISASRKVKAHEERDALSNEHLNKIFSVSWFQTGKGEMTPAGKYYSFRPYYYWLPLLALYCGGRLNELCQLYLKDIVVSDSIAFIDFNLDGHGKADGDTDKSLKNVNSIRCVPIPASILKLGFLEYVSALKLSGEERLFPELPLDAVKGYGKQAGSWFNERFLGKKLEIPRDGRSTFHSMRHNFATALGEAGTSSNDKADLLGHSREGTMSDIRYDKGNAARLKRCIDQVKHAHPPITKFDVEQGLLAVKHALELKKSRKGRGL